MFVVVVTLALGLGACSNSQHEARPLRLQGTTLRQGGHRFVVKGATAYMVPFYLDGNEADPDLARTVETDFAERERIFATMAAVGVNTVRIPVSLQAWESRAYGEQGASYLAHLRATVAAASAADLQVVVGWWSSPQTSDLLHSFRDDAPMIRGVLAVLHPWPVIYEPYNEPPGRSWAQWRQLMAETISEWRGSFHYAGLLVLDTIGYSWQFSPAAAKAVEATDAAFLRASARLLFANHRYPNGNECFCGTARAAWVATVGSEVSRYPILGTEYGVFDDDGPPEVDWMQGFLRYLQTVAIPQGLNGAIAFVWHWVDPNSLTTASSPTVLDGYGDVVRAGLWKQR